MRVFLVRHGESTWNAIGRVQGQTRQVGLTTLGVDQAAAVARYLASEAVDVLLTSDLDRAAHTAAVVAEATGLAAIADWRLREQGYGSMEGCRFTDAAFAEVDWTDPTARVGGGECLEEVYRRVGELLRTRIAAGRSPGHRGIVLVTHGETIRAAIAWLLGLGSHAMPRDIPPNGSVTKIRIADGAAADVTTVVPTRTVRRLVGP